MRKILTIAFLFLLLLACNSIGSYNITGEIGDNTLDGKQVTLFGLSDKSEMVPLDSVVIKNGTFKLKGDVDTAGWFILLIKKDNGQVLYKDFYAEGKLLVKLANNSLRISGSPVNETYQAFEDSYSALTKNLIKLDALLKADPENKEIKQSFNDEYLRFEKSFRELALKTIKKNISNPAGVHLFKAALSSLENEDIESILAIAEPEFLRDPSVKMVVDQLEMSKKIGVGSRFADLSMFTPEGTPISLSEYLGKGTYVLIDFWASWCGPCIRELPNVLSCYKKYHNKGFDIIGVSLDEDSKAWKAAIRKFNLPWPQMSDLAGWQSKAVTTYSFSGIPHTVLVDPQGLIIAKDLRGTALEEKLAELISK